MLIRIFDIIFSLVAMLFHFPFMIPVMIGLKFTGEHYIFYLQPRVGSGGRDFNVFKFATMLKDSPNLPGGVLT
ncbi:MAG: sugar transferase, partial [Rectinemataceae bacterium]